MAVVSSLLVLAAGLLFGDGVITPAISVISAIEGLTVATEAFSPYVVPITLTILTGLFLIQSQGTHKIGKLFGPVVSIWFVAIALIGVSHLVNHLDILLAFNPVYAINFVLHHSLHTLLIVLGSVMLVVTGGEAMYADMGHFGRNPIRLSWFGLTYPALILNYLGQGAFLLGHEHLTNHNIFFAMVPGWALIPMVILATMATIIASQALITGAFSLASQAMSLGLLPYLKIIHTNKEHHGQIYMPSINWLLWAGCMMLVIGFKSSSNLASAYGLAVSGVMLVTSLGMFGVAKYYWNWSWLKTAIIFVPLALVDASFLTANSLKFLEGGYVPLSIGLIIMAIMKTWQWGESRTHENLNGVNLTLGDLLKQRRRVDHVLPTTSVMMSDKPITQDTDKVPAIKKVFLERYGLLPKNLIFLTIINEETPHIDGDRCQLTKLYVSKDGGCILSVVYRFGFMEVPDMEVILEHIASKKEFKLGQPQNWLLHELRGIILPSKQMSLWNKVKFGFFKFMYNNFGQDDGVLGGNNSINLSVEAVPAVLK